MLPDHASSCFLLRRAGCCSYHNHDEKEVRIPDAPNDGQCSAILEPLLLHAPKPFAALSTCVLRSPPSCQHLHLQTLIRKGTSKPQSVLEHTSTVPKPWTQETSTILLQRFKFTEPRKPCRDLCKALHQKNSKPSSHMYKRQRIANMQKKNVLMQQSICLR